MQTGSKAKLVGINHVALEVGDVEEALRFYGGIFEFSLRGTQKDDTGRTTMAFIDMGDQFLALSADGKNEPDAQRHFGLVVDDRSRVRDFAMAAGARMLEGSFLDFLDPWGNRVEIIEYRDVQFSKSPAMLTRLGVSPAKTDKVKAELMERGLRAWDPLPSPEIAVFRRSPPGEQIEIKFGDMQDAQANQEANLDENR